jgi:hypothetical protein
MIVSESNMIDSDTLFRQLRQVRTGFCKSVSFLVRCLQQKNGEPCSSLGGTLKSRNTVSRTDIGIPRMKVLVLQGISIIKCASFSMFFHIDRVCRDDESRRTMSEAIGAEITAKTKRPFAGQGLHRIDSQLLVSFCYANNVVLYLFPANYGQLGRKVSHFG